MYLDWLFFHIHRLFSPSPSKTIYRDSTVLKPRAQLYCVDNIFLNSNIFNHIIRQNIQVRKLLPPPSICKERSLNTLWLQTIGSGKSLQFTSGRIHISNRISTNTHYIRQCRGHTVEPRSIVFQGTGENKRMRGNDQSGKLLHITWCVQDLRSPNLLKKNYSPQEAENAVISQRNHPVDVHIFHNAHATIAWPQQTLL